ncbi:glycosyltransferase, partial [Vibrio parahaemolyticus]
MREDLQSLIHKYQLENQVFLLGIQSNPYAFMSEANVFISSSRFEGFPNVVIESLICGTPVVSNNYLGGI